MGCTSSSIKEDPVENGDVEPLMALDNAGLENASQHDELHKDRFLPLQGTSTAAVGIQMSKQQQQNAAAKQKKTIEFPVAPGYQEETKLYNAQQQREQQQQSATSSTTEHSLSFSALIKPESATAPFVEPEITQQGFTDPIPIIHHHAQSSPKRANTKKESKKKKKKKKKAAKAEKKAAAASSGGEAQTTTTITTTNNDNDTPQPSSKSGLRFDELYRLKGVLGTGAFSTVREGTHRSSTTNTFAVKCVNRKKLSDEDEAALLDEVSILQELRHVHIIRLYDFFMDPTTYYLIMERMSGGELFDRIVAKAYYNEKEARDVCKIVLEAVDYCHVNSVAHRDLKPENLLLLSQNDDSTVKIADFGFAKKVRKPCSLTTQCGTPGYVAPEILEGIPYDTRADMWSVGVILYILLGGYPPFIENNQRELFRKIRKGDYEFHAEYWGSVSAEAKELIQSLLTVSPVKRLTATRALQNPWIKGDDDELANRDLAANLKKLTNFNAKRKFKAAVSTVMAVNKLQSLGNDFLKNLS